MKEAFVREDLLDVQHRVIRIEYSDRRVEQRADSHLRNGSLHRAGQAHVSLIKLVSLGSTGTLVLAKCLYISINVLTNKYR